MPETNAKDRIPGRVTMAHGGGGTAMRDLVQNVFAAQFGTDMIEDQARFDPRELLEPGSQFAFTTDSFVVTPVEFAGGDIGKLAVCGTVNDLAVGGAKPAFLSAAFIIEEGCELALLHRIAQSMAQEARAVNVKIVTGDTKVVEAGAADKVFINTSGVGIIPPGRKVSARSVQAGDILLSSGFLGDHGAAILAAREDLALSTDLTSDCASLSELMRVTLEAVPDLRAARDATRGGIASALNEVADASGVAIEIEENALRIRSEVRGMCEILGLDPLYLANEGTLVAFVPPGQAVAALSAMRSVREGRDACVIGKVVEGVAGRVSMRTQFGGLRLVDMLVGEQLPRIC